MCLRRLSSTYHRSFHGIGRRIATMKPTHKLVLGLLSIYKYLMSFLATIFLFVLPSVVPRPYFRQSMLLDLSVRVALCLYLVFGYWSLTNNLTKRIRKNTAQSSNLTKNMLAFVSFALSGLAFCLFLGILTWWSILTFIPWFPKTVIALIALGNGCSYALLVFSQYFLLPEDE